MFFPIVGIGDIELTGCMEKLPCRVAVTNARVIDTANNRQVISTNHGNLQIAADGLPFAVGSNDGNNQQLALTRD